MRWVRFWASAELLGLAVSLAIVYLGSVVVNLFGRVTFGAQTYIGVVACTVGVSSLATYRAVQDGDARFGRRGRRRRDRAPWA
jgi:hypothetical protein